MITALLILAHVCLTVGILFFFYGRAYKRGCNDTRASLIGFAGHRAIDCDVLARKRKGNNFGDQMYRAALKGNADAYRDIANTLRES